MKPQVTYIIGAHRTGKTTKLNQLKEEYSGEMRFNDGHGLQAMYNSKKNEHYLFLDEGNHNLTRYAPILRDYLTLPNVYSFIVFEEEGHVEEFEKRFSKQLENKERETIKLPILN